MVSVVILKVIVVVVVGVVLSMIIRIVVVYMVCKDWVLVSNVIMIWIMFSGVISS